MKGKGTILSINLKDGAIYTEDGQYYLFIISEIKNGQEYNPSGNPCDLLGSEVDFKVRPGSWGGGKP